MAPHDDRHPDSLLRLKDVQTFTGLSSSCIYRLAQAGSFPKPRKLGPRASAWRWGDLLEWAQSREPATAAADDRGAA